jgi:SAM-dependent methyltransferase
LTALTQRFVLLQSDLRNMRTDVDHLSAQELRESREAWWSTEFDDFLWAVFAHLSTGPVLDVGCGVGTLAQRLSSRLPPRTRCVGVDVDFARVVAASRGVASYAAADGLCLPFCSGSFQASVVILTLQHVSEPVRVLSEMRRVTGRGGIVAAVEPDNADQRLYFPYPSGSVDRAIAAFWRCIQESHKSADIAIGPRLPHLFLQANLPRPSVKGFLLTHTSWVEPSEFIEQAKSRFQNVARKYGVQESSECQALLEAIQAQGMQSSVPFYTLAAVPLFLVVAHV